MLDRINTKDPTKKNIDKKTYDMYQDIVSDSMDVINTINATGMTEPRKRLLEILILIEETLMSKKVKTIPEETGLRSEKLDTAQGGKSESEEKSEQKGQVINTILKWRQYL